MDDDHPGTNGWSANQRSGRVKRDQNTEIHRRLKATALAAFILSGSRNQMFFPFGQTENAHEPNIFSFHLLVFSLSEAP
jgi:hypothetical protein